MEVFKNKKLFEKIDSLRSKNLLENGISFLENRIFLGKKSLSCRKYEPWT